MGNKDKTLFGKMGEGKASGVSVTKSVLRSKGFTSNAKKWSNLGIDIIYGIWDLILS